MEFKKGQPYTEIFSKETSLYRYIQNGNKYRRDFSLYETRDVAQDGKINVEEQLPEIVLPASDRPYTTRNRAEFALSRKKDKDTLKIVSYKDGYALQRVEG